MFCYYISQTFDHQNLKRLTQFSRSSTHFWRKKKKTKLQRPAKCNFNCLVVKIVLSVLFLDTTTRCQYANACPKRCIGVKKKKTQPDRQTIPPDTQRTERMNGEHLSSCSANSTHQFYQCVWHRYLSVTRLSLGSAIAAHTKESLQMRHVNDLIRFRVNKTHLNNILNSTRKNTLRIWQMSGQFNFLCAHVQTHARQKQQQYLKLIIETHKHMSASKNKLYHIWITEPWHMRIQKEKKWRRRKNLQQLIGRIVSETAITMLVQKNAW